MSVKICLSSVSREFVFKIYTTRRNVKKKEREG